MTGIGQLAFIFRMHNIYSCTKSVMGSLVGIVVQQGKSESLRKTGDGNLNAQDSPVCHICLQVAAYG
jgi:hypothetical protein